MKKINDYIVYRKLVCKIIDIKDNKYTLVPMSDDSIKMQVPTDSKFLRDLITKEEIDKLLIEMPTIDVINNRDKIIEGEYKELMTSGTHQDLIKIIKTAYMRNEQRRMNNKKTSDKDNEYFERAEKYLYEELSVVLNKSYDETKEYVIDKVTKYAKNICISS